MIDQHSFYTRALRHKISTFDPANPLNLSPSSVVWFRWLVPLFVLYTVASLVFTWRVLKSRWIRPLVSFPALRQLTLLALITMMCGPAYVWFMQQGCGVSTKQVYLCFLLQWVHNFALIASAWTLVLLLIERSVTVYSPEVRWPKLRHQMVHLTSYILVISMLSSVIGLLIYDVSTQPGHAYPVCSPWWVNETPGGFAWYWVVCLQFSIIPALFIAVSMVTLKFSLARFKTIVREQVDEMEHYSGLFLELCTKSSDKFCRSGQWLGVVFLFTYLPLGCFILTGPVIQYRMTGAANLTPTPAQPDVTKTRDAITSQRLENLTATHFKPRPQFNKSSLHISSGLSSSEVNTSRGLVLGGRSLLVGGAEDRKEAAHSYVINLSRTTAEVVVWMLSYCFPAILLPVLMATEVIFRREAYGRYLQTKHWVNRRLLRFQTGQSGYKDVDTQSEESKTPGNPADGLSEGDQAKDSQTKDTAATRTGKEQGVPDRQSESQVPVSARAGSNRGGNCQHSDCAAPGCGEDKTAELEQQEVKQAEVKQAEVIRPKPRRKKSKVNVSIANTRRGGPTTEAV